MHRTDTLWTQTACLDAPSRDLAESACWCASAREAPLTVESFTVKLTAGLEMSVDVLALVPQCAGREGSVPDIRIHANGFFPNLRHRCL